MLEKKLFIDGIIYSLQTNGGISTLFNELIKRLPLDFYHLSLYKNNNFNININANNIFFNEYRNFERYRNCKINKKMKLFHSTYYRLPDDKKVISIQTIHDFTYEKYSSNIKKYIHVAQKRNAIYNSDILICVSNNTKSDLINYYGSKFEDRCKVIYNAASNDYFNHNKDGIYKQNILFIGQRSGYKNFNFVLKTLKYNKSFFLDIIGGGDLTKDELNFLEREMPYRYKFWGNVTNKTLNDLYNISFCLLYPSLYEGFGIPILEAMQAGCPVIAFNNSAISEIVDRNENLLISDDISEISFFLEKLNNTEFRQTIIKYGIERSKYFSYNNTFNQTMNLYNINF
jgi:mannosyltransferase